jgi:predicted 2-oxoglutarate/Fe(II)-dependent dioxygenase YbiX
MTFIIATILVSSTLVVILAIKQIYLHFTSPLKHIPCPFFAKYTNLWRFFDHLDGRTELTQQILHKKYGPVIRLGPDLISLGDPD